MTDYKLFQEPQASELMTLRSRARRKRRITYDCMSAIVYGDQVRCKKGHEFRTIGRSGGNSLSVRTVLRGTASSACKKCQDYDGEEHE